MDHVPYAVLFSSQPIMIDTHFFKQVFVPLGINDYFATFHVVSKIGQGAFGDVYSVRKDSRLFALKKAIKPFTGYKDAYYIFT